MSREYRDLLKAAPAGEEEKGLRIGRSKMGRAARVLSKLNVARSHAIERGDGLLRIVDAHYSRTAIARNGLRAPPQ